MWKLRAVPLMGALLAAGGFALGRLAGPLRAPSATGAAWLGACAATPARPWRSECRFFEATPLALDSAKSPPYWVCLRDVGDPESDAVRIANRFPRCDDALALWNERMLPRDPGDLYIDVGAGLGGCALLMAAAGADVRAVESDPDLLFRLTSAVLANAPALRIAVLRNVTEVTLLRNVADAPRVRVMRVAADVPAALDFALRAAGARVRTIKLERGLNSSVLLGACQRLEAAGYTLYRGGAPVARAAHCSSGGLEPADIVAHAV